MPFNRTSKKSEFYDLPNGTVSQETGLNTIIFNESTSQTIETGDRIIISLPSPIQVTVNSVIDTTAVTTVNTLSAFEDTSLELLKTVDFSYSEDTTKYSDLDLANNVIFVPIETSIDLRFSRAIKPETLIPYTNNLTVEPNYRGKKGSIILTHIVNTSEGPNSLDNNEKALSAQSKPSELSNLTISADPDDSVVEMTNLPSTLDNTSFSFIPVANLASNTTYYLNLSKVDILDDNDITIKYNVGDGFVTDNSRSAILSTSPYSGFTLKTTENPLEDGETRGRIEKGDTITINRSNPPFSATVKSVNVDKVTYELSYDAYVLNVSFQAGLTTTIFRQNHKLLTDDKIEIFDVVSGTVSTGKYNVTKLNDNSFTIDLDTSGSSDGYLNYFTNFKRGDEINYTINSDTINETVDNAPVKNTVKFDDILENSLMKVVRDKLNISIGTDNLSRFIREGRVNNSISYVNVDVNDSIISDTYANNMMLEVNNGGQKVFLHIKANTAPSNNTHPFNTSAPFVSSTFPADGSSLTAKLQVISITRNGSEATVTTNHPHNFSKYDYIEIFDANETIFNKQTQILNIIDSTSFTYDLGINITVDTPSEATGIVKIRKKDTSNEYVDKFNCLQVFFSQSMNTSTISVANSSFLIYANGSVTSFGQKYSQDDSTIQISYDGFTNLVNCESIKANTGNSQFTIETDRLLRGKSYKIKVKNSVSDLGKTPMTYEYETSDAIITGFRGVDPETGVETIFFGDLEPPTVRKIYFSQTGTSGVAGKVLESNTFAEITSPENFDDVSIDLDNESLYVRFSESVNTGSVTVNTVNTSPTGTIQLSCDDFRTVVQMSTLGFLSIAEDNDTVVLTPKSNLSSNSTYKVKVFNTITDIAKNPNKLSNDNVSCIRVMTLSTIPQVENYYESGEIIRGTKTIDIKTSLGEPTEGLTVGSEFTGRTSQGKGKVLEYFTGGSLKLEDNTFLLFEDDRFGVDNLTLEEYENIASITYTEIKSADGSIKEILNGEVCDVSDSIRFSVGSASIEPAAEGTVISFDETSKKVIYREKNPLYVFKAGDRVYGSTNDGIGQATEPLQITNVGFTTTTTDLTANAKFYVLDSNNNIDLLSLTDDNITGVKTDSNVIINFNQTINVDTISFNTINSSVLDEHTIILSYDSSFGNCIPLSSTFLRSNNDTAFEFRPLLLTNSNVHLTQNNSIYVRITDGIQTKGTTNLSTTKTFSNSALVTSNDNFQAITATVYGSGGTQIQLNVIERSDTIPSDVPGTLTNKASNVSNTTPIIIEFNEEIASATNFSMVTTDGTTNHIELTTDSDFAADSGEIETVSITKIGDNGNRLVIVPSSPLASLTRYYLRVLNNTGNENVKEKPLDQNTYFQSFTTE